MKEKINELINNLKNVIDAINKKDAKKTFLLSEEITRFITRDFFETKLLTSAEVTSLLLALNKHQDTLISYLALVMIIARDFSSSLKRHENFNTVYFNLEIFLEKTSSNVLIDISFMFDDQGALLLKEYKQARGEKHHFTSRGQAQQTLLGKARKKGEIYTIIPESLLIQQRMMMWMDDFEEMNLSAKTHEEKKTSTTDDMCKYLTRAQKKPFKLRIDSKHHTLTSSASGEISNGDFIYIISPKGSLYISNISHYPMHHSCFRAGQPVLCAGEIEFLRGRIKSINNLSGHYIPPATNLVFSVMHLLVKGYIDLDTVCVLHSTVTHSEKIFTVLELIKIHKGELYVDDSIKKDVVKGIALFIDNNMSVVEAKLLRHERKLEEESKPHIQSLRKSILDAFFEEYYLELKRGCKPKLSYFSLRGFDSSNCSLNQVLKYIHKKDSKFNIFTAKRSRYILMKVLFERKLIGPDWHQIPKGEDSFSEFLKNIILNSTQFYRDIEEIKKYKLLLSLRVSTRVKDKKMSLSI